MLAITKRPERNKLLPISDEDIEDLMQICVYQGLSYPAEINSSLLKSSIFYFSQQSGLL